jgi:hypothetical protein
MSDPTNTDDTIDSRDVIARIEELESEREELQDAVTAALERREELEAIEAPTLAEADELGLSGSAETALNDWDRGSAGEELAALKALQDEAEGYAPDWHHGTTLIRDSYFNEYMDELLQDIGDIPKDLPSYLTVTVDYDALQSDYTAVEFSGVTYWVR